MEKQFIEGFKLENQRLLLTITLTSLCTQLIIYLIFFHLLLVSEFKDLDIFKIQSTLALSFNFIWMSYTLISYFHQKRFKVSHD
jgi:hypothetical protein